MNRRITRLAWLLSASCAAALFGALPAEAQFVSYHDLGATTGFGSTGFITTHQFGLSTASGNPLDTTSKSLINYSNGALTGVNFQITSSGGVSGMDSRNAAQTSPPNAGTPADPLFNVAGLNLNNGTIFQQNGILTLAFSGLDPSLRYDLALFGNRNVAADGAEQFTLSSTDSATNASSIGIVDQFTTNLETRNNQTLGHVARWLDIAPGVDGMFTVSMNPAFASSTTNIGYLSALRLQATAVPEPTAFVVWSLLGLGLIGFGWFHVRRGD